MIGGGGQFNLLGVRLSCLVLCAIITLRHVLFTCVLAVASQTSKISRPY